MFCCGLGSVRVDPYCLVFGLVSCRVFPLLVGFGLTHFSKEIPLDFSIGEKIYLSLNDYIYIYLSFKIKNKIHIRGENVEYSYIIVLKKDRLSSLSGFGPS